MALRRYNSLGEQGDRPSTRFAEVMLHTINQTHIWHLQTDSYAIHIALGGYYDCMTTQFDDIVEKMMGIDRNRIGVPNLEPIVSYSDVDQVKNHILLVKAQIEKCQKHYSTNSEIMSDLDIIKSQVDKTCYLLTLG